MASREKKQKLHETDSDTNEEDNEKCNLTQQSSSSTKGKIQRRLTSVSGLVLEKLEKSCPGVFRRVKPSEYSSSRPTVKCTLCNTFINISCGVKDAKAHTTTQKHHLNSVRTAISFDAEMSTEEDSQALDAEILMSQFIASNNLSFSTACNLVKLCKRMFPDSSIVKKITCDATKATKISSCLGESYTATVIDKLRTQNFTLMIDEFTDHGAEKMLALLARSFDPGTKTTETYFVTLLECDTGTARFIFNTMDQFFTEQKIPWTNVIAFESDNFAVMKGKHNGVITLIKEKNFYVVDLGSIAHFTNLCLKEGNKKFPFKPDELLTDICYHFEVGDKRTETLKSYFADFPNVEYQAILRHCPTRWLSMRPCLSRLIQHFDVLKAYFLDQEAAAAGEKVKLIKATLTDPRTLPLLHFLEEILEPVDSYNKLFQKEEFILVKSYDASLTLLTDMLGRILPPAEIREHLRSDPKQIDLSNYLPDDDIDFGPSCRLVLATIDDETLPQTEKQVLEAGKQFIIDFVKKMNKVVPYELMKAVKSLDPAEFNNLKLSHFTQLSELFHITDMNNYELKRDIRMLLCDPPQTINNNPNTVQFWTTVHSLYPATVGKIISHVLCLPNSNASTERAFSILKAVHTPVRNNLKLPTINSIISLNINKKSQSYILEADDALKERCTSLTHENNLQHCTTADRVNSGDG